MYDHIHQDLYASIATLDQLKKMYDLGAVDIRSFQRESDALVSEVKGHLDEMRRMGIDVGGFMVQQRILDEFPDAAGLIEFYQHRSRPVLDGYTMDEYYDHLGLAILDVATTHSAKGLMGLADLIVEVVNRVPQFKSVSYNDVIEAVNRVAENGLIPGIRTLRGGVKVVELRPLELRGDQSDVVNLAATKGYTSVEEVMMELKWSEDHARQVLSSLVDAGMAVADIRFSTGGRYYFPGLHHKSSEKANGHGMLDKRRDARDSPPAHGL